MTSPTPRSATPTTKMAARLLLRQMKRITVENDCMPRTVPATWGAWPVTPGDLGPLTCDDPRGSPPADMSPGAGVGDSLTAWC